MLDAAGLSYPQGPLYTPRQVVDLSLQVKSSQLPNYAGLKIPLRTHLNLPALNFVLAQYPDPWPLLGSTYGWPLDRDPAVHLSGVTWPNHSSALRNIDQVDKYLWEEVHAGAIFPLGPTTDRLVLPVSTIPLLTVPKPPHPHKVRVCGDMSFPSGAAVNDGTSSEVYCGEPFKVKLPTIWDFLALVREVGLENAVLAKADLSRGYRQMPICPGNWQDQLLHVPHIGYLMDTRAIFGGRPCGGFMQRFNQAVTWAAVNTAISLELSPSLSSCSMSLSHEKPFRAVDSSTLSPSHAKPVSTVDSPTLPPSSKSTFRACAPYVDDAMLVMHKACAASVWNNVLSIYKACGVSLSSTPGHVFPASQTMCALGFDVDCDTGMVSIPAHKVSEMLVLAKAAVRKGRVTRQEVKQLLGRLCRCIMVIREGRKFIGRLLQLIQGPTQPSHEIVDLPDEARADLSWWISHAPSLNLKAIISPTPLSTASVFLTDGRGSSKDGPPSVGGLCHITKQLFSLTTPPSLHHEPVHVIEAVAVLAAARIWVPHLPLDRVIPVGCDNQAVVHACQGGKARDPQLAAMSRLLWGVFSSSSSTFKVLYVPSEQNTADGVSRLNPEHVRFLLACGWQQLFPPPVYFELDEVNPLLYQAVTLSSCPQPQAYSSCSPPPGVRSRTGRASAASSSSSAGPSDSPVCPPARTPSSSSPPTSPLSGACPWAPSQTTWQASGKST